jgi:NADH-quinone oxidoreductase subunit M
MGYVLMGLAAMNTVSLTGAASQMFAHGIMAALFFALVGLVYQRTHTRMIADFGGLAHQMPRAATLFLITGLASLGLPGFFNFVSEFLIFVGAFKVFPVLATLSILAVVITAIYVLRVVQQIFFGPRNPRWDNLKDISGMELLPFIILTVVMLGFGLAPSPMIKLINQGIDPIVQHQISQPTEQPSVKGLP